MYNEYDIIDSFMKNLIEVDVTTDVNIDINSQWKVIDGVKLKPGHLVLLKSQNSNIENDVYLVTEQFFLTNSNLLSSRDKTFRMSCSVKLGSNSDKQFFLDSDTIYDYFPIIGEPKTFILGNSFILKNLINYNMSSMEYVSKPKMIFTDYDLARKQLSDNSELYYNFDFTINTNQIPNVFLEIDYHEESYTIISGTTESSSFSGETSDILNLSNMCVPYPESFNYTIGDSVKIVINSGVTTFLTFDTFIKMTGVTNSINYLILEESIPNRILNDLKNTTYSFENMQIAINWDDAILKMKNTPYSNYFKVVSGNSTPSLMTIIVKPKKCDYNKYFDYDGLRFFIEDYNYDYTFTSTNPYIKYKLFDFLNAINPIFTTNFKFFNEYILDSFSYNYTDNNRIRIYTSVSGLTNIFKAYTYVNVFGDSMTSRALIYSVYNNEIIIEKPLNWNSNITHIQNIDGLGNISSLLYYVYKNNNFNWYVRKNDNERKYISRSYAELLILNSDIRDNITGILYENENNEFLLKLYGIGDINNNTISTDDNLFYSVIDAIYIGSDKKSRLPISIKTTQLNL